MLQAFEPVMGAWWRQDAPDVVLSGYLNRVDAEQPGYNWSLLIDGDLGQIRSGYETSVTLFGDTAAGRLTLHHATPMRWRTSQSSSGTKTMSHWEGFRLVAGDHVPVDELYSHASFGIPHAIDWLGPSRLNAYAKPSILAVGSDHDGVVEMDSASISSDLQLHASLVRSESSSPLGRSRQHRWDARYHLDSESGLTLDQLMGAAHALSLLQSLAFGTRLEGYGFQFAQPNADQPRSIEVVDAHPPRGHAWRGLGPFFDTSEIDFDSVCSAWVSLLKQVPLAETLIAPREQNAAVQVVFLAQCSALEALAQGYWAGPSVSQTDQQILDVLAAGGINSRRRATVENLLRQRRWPLETKLITAAAMAGECSSNWLLGNVADWAHLVMRLRNSLAHGGALPAGLGENVEFVIEAQRSVAAVAQLALLRQLGYVNRLGSPTGELLWSESGTVASHVNSDFFNELESLASRAAQWQQWRRQIDGHGD